VIVSGPETILNMMWIVYYWTVMERGFGKGYIISREKGQIEGQTSSPGIRK
jgi:hypothetical protein